MRWLLTLGLMSLALLAAGVLTPSAEAHRDGCHRWHTCPSDSNSYVCGDAGRPCQYPADCGLVNCGGSEPRSGTGASGASEGNGLFWLFLLAVGGYITWFVVSLRRAGRESSEEAETGPTSSASGAPSGPPTPDPAPRISPPLPALMITCPRCQASGDFKGRDPAFSRFKAGKFSLEEPQAFQCLGCGGGVWYDPPGKSRPMNELALTNLINMAIALGQRPEAESSSH